MNIDLYDDRIKTEILDLIESPELHVYLMEHARTLIERLCQCAGAPVRLKRKKELLYR